MRTSMNSPNETSSIPALDEANEKALHGLVEVLGQGMGIALVGAGSSKRAGYPLWDEFIEKEMAAELVRIRPSASVELDSLSREPDLLWRAEEYRRCWGTTHSKR